MKDVFEAIKHRRSVRSYQDKPVPREMIETILDAGNWAPTGNNDQTWRFVVAQDKAFVAQLVEAARPTFIKIVTTAKAKNRDPLTQAYFADFGPRCLGWDVTTFEENMAALIEMQDGVYWGAPVIIFVIGTRAGRDAECAMVSENMMLAADALGLGSCVVGFGSFVTDDAEVVAALELKEHEKLHAPVVIGYPAIQPEPPPKKPPMVKWI